MSFHLLDLPYVPLKLVMDHMNIGNLLKLSVCSKRSQLIVKLNRYKLDSLNIRLRNGNSEIVMKRTKDRTSIEFDETGSSLNWMNWILSKWLVNEYEKNLHSEQMRAIQDFTNFSIFLRSIFEVKIFSWSIFMEKNQRIEDIRGILSASEYQELAFSSERIDTKSLSYLLDSIQPSVKLTMTGIIPPEFKHKKAFSLESSEYEDARWVSIEDLLSLRGYTYLKLGQTNFDNNDINRLLHCWKSSLVEMFLELTIKPSASVERDWVTIWKGLNKLYRHKTKAYYILPDIRVNRFPVLRVRSEKGFITFTVLPNSPAIPTLMAFERKKYLEKFYEDLQKEENMVRKQKDQNEMPQFNNNNTTFEEEIQRIQDHRRKVQAEFAEIVETLLDRNITNFGNLFLR